jgi:hypothetical protein
MKNLLFTLVMFLAATSFSNAQNGYSLEFEDVVTLSVETTAIPGANTGSKTYTVPANTVLKISSGCISYYNSTNFVTLAVGNETITNINTDALTSSNNVIWQPIWAKEGIVITLTYSIDSTTLPNVKSVNCGHISGTLFRKVAN